MEQQPISEEEARKKFSELRKGVSSHSISIPPKTIDEIINEELQLLDSKFTPMPDDVTELIHSREGSEKRVKEESDKHQTRPNKAPLNELDAMARWQKEQENDTD